MSSRVLVTGGAGFIGSHLVDALLAKGRAVSVLDDFSTGERDNLVSAAASGDLRVLEGSILDREVVSRAMADCDMVFHLAVASVRRSLGRPVENHDINATGMLNVLEEARRRKVGRFVYCSSSEVYGNCGGERLGEKALPEPVTVYGASKLAGEHYAKAYWRTYAVPTTVVRPFNSYGPREHDQGDAAEVIPRFVIRVLNGLPPVIFGSGDAARDFTYVTETAQGIMAAAACDAMLGQVVNIAFGRMVSIREVAAAVARHCGRPELVATHIEARPGDVHVLQADTSVAKSMLKFEARIDFEEGLARYIAWFRKRYPDPSLLLEEDPRNWRMPGS
jgi:UDP-glucose 4-epimerase